MAANDRPIFLVGFMGSGKSTLAPALAARLGWVAIETDERVAALDGRPVGTIFAESGEARFRQLEGDVLASLEGLQSGVVATGGGMFCDAGRRRWMKQRGRTVWLDVPLETCARRVAQGGRRPLWQPADPIAFRAFFERRRAVYALAELRLAPTGDAPDAAIEQLLARFPLIFGRG